jgi:hypothetical protein
MREDAPLRARWDLLVAALVLASCWLIPAQVAFSHQVTALGTVLVLLIDAVFWADIALNFRTSFRREGLDVTDPALVMSHYRRGLFRLDLLANLPVDLLLLPWAGVTVGNVSIVLLARLPRLLRLVRLGAILSRWRRRSRGRTSALRIGTFVIYAGLLLHLAACAWFAVPYMEGLPHDAWIVREGIAEATPTTQYVRSLYWAVVTTTTVGYGDITPTRNVEYVFTMAVILLGASLYAFVIGNIASLFSGLDAAKSRFDTRLATTEDYLRARQVPRELGDRVRGYYEYMWERYHGFPDQALLHDLPAALRLEVLERLTEGLLEQVPLFRRSEGSLRQALVLALQPQTLPPDVTLVRDGEAPEGVYFVGRGELEILSEGGERSHGTFVPGDHFGLLSLVLGERRTAAVVTRSYCDVFVLHKADFERIKRDYAEFGDVVKAVASEGGERLSALLLEGVTL